MNRKLNILKQTKSGNISFLTPLPLNSVVFHSLGQGLYGWTTRSEYLSGNYRIKFGQYGTFAAGGSTPQKTIGDYLGVTTDAVVIVWAIRLTDDEIQKHKSAYAIEQKVGAMLGKPSKWGSSTEVWETTLDNIKEKVNGVLYGVSDSKLQTFSPRESQSKFINKYLKHRLNGGDQFLLGAIMRYGKNFAWLTAQYELLKSGVVKKGDVLLVLTAKPGVFKTLKEDIENHVYFRDFDYIKMQETTEGDSPKLNPNKVTVLAVSTQLAYNKRRRKTRKFLQSLNFRDVFIDECHSGTETVNFNDLLKGLSTDHLTFVSGTPFKTEASRGFTSETSFFYGYPDQQKKKKQDQENGIDNDSVTIKTYVPAISDEYKTNPNYSDDEQFSITKLLATNPDGSFVFGGDVVNFVKDVLGKSDNKSKYSPFRFCDADLNHTVWLLPPSVATAKAMGKVINQVAPEYQVIVASGDETKDIDVVKDAIKESEKTITLTIGRFVEGTTVKPWNGCLVMSDTKSVEKYFQFIFRVASPKEGKDTGYVFDFSPERAFEMVFEMATAQANNENRDDSQKVLREWLDCNNVYRMGDGPQPKSVDISDILDHIRNGDYRAATLTRTYADWLNRDNIDDSLIDKLSGLKTKKKQVVKTEMNTNGMGGGKNYNQTNNKEKAKPIGKSELKKAIENIVGIIAALPLLASAYDQTTIDGIINNAHPESIQEACKVDANTLQLLITESIINPRHINNFL